MINSVLNWRSDNGKIKRIEQPFESAVGFLRPLLYFCALSIIFATLLPSLVAAKPLGGPIGTLNDAFRTQDKICSVGHIDGQGSYRQLVGTLAGLDVGALGHSKKIYTGFKFHQVFSFKGLFDKVQPKIKMTYCSLGKVQWQTEQNNFPGSEWNSPICVYTPASAPSVAKSNRFWRKFAPRRTSEAEILSSHKQRATEDLDNFHCFKLARREKYFHRNMSIHLPNKWVGGIFYCDLDNDAKRTILGGMSDSLESQNLENAVVCKTDNTIPLEPLISDSYLKHWTEVNPKSKLPFLRRISRTHMKKTVPFLHTPLAAPFSGNFSIQNRVASNTSALNGQTFSLANHLSWLPLSKDTNEQWFTDIEPEESYDDILNANKGISRVEDTIRRFEKFLVRAGLRNYTGS
ncbi:uncharacterized protein LALA0_S05e06568g [Lachancea lanzarotensis]|uniref:LALA0S05e06568g1_1 n=1 Tax=Lachancea lanzarotensis TaxID=1245769 RepID=A0A0C7MXS7_9SACH|nr:uncharacterized protein LALA0_S05e06568g [Lachancea lanzarotensis]CEP62479.1 LALA0S05e06568g1_1 [Lachancea lanzarotensis]